MKILVINGPNLNFLGRREPEHYGTGTYEELCMHLTELAKSLSVELTIFQSNCEGEIIDRIQAAYDDGTEGLIINPGAYSHYSYAIHDALLCLKMPKMEVHLSNIQKREEFRRVSVTAPACNGQICGLGFESYDAAMKKIIIFKNFS